MVHPSKNLTGNARYYGFCIDLLDHVAGMVGFNYEVSLEHLARYGNYNQTTGEWDGMVRIVMEKVLTAAGWRRWRWRWRGRSVQSNWCFA